MPERILVWGCGGHGKVVADLVRACGHAVVGFADADVTRLGEEVEPGGGRMITSASDLQEHLSVRSQLPGDATGIVLAIGDNGARMKLLRLVGSYLAPAMVHPTAVISPSARVAKGTVVLAGVVVNAAATIGEGVILNTSCVVEHDCRIAAAVHVSPGAVLAGGVTVGERSWIGAGAVLIQQVSVGRDVVVGAGAVVVRDVSDESSVVGVPARPIRSQSLPRRGE